MKTPCGSSGPEGFSGGRDAVPPHWNPRPLGDRETALLERMELTVNYVSTRSHKPGVTASQAIVQGLSPEGGLFVPESLPALELDDLEGLSDMPYTERAIQLLSLFLMDFSDKELVFCAESAYTPEKFPGDTPAPLRRLSDGLYMLELWHGPTCAFKDMALQLLPYLLTVSAKHQKKKRETVILTATSGDTGKAALEGFRDVPGVKIAVFYPRDGVSSMQKRQMVTQEGENVFVCAIEGNFDDAQAGVKQVFTDAALAARMEAKGLRFSSANSINWGRLLPQIVYYVSAYCDLVKREGLTLGDEVNVCVPTGNFGNLLAAYYAKRMGVPFKKLICASNRNCVLTDFLKTGVYDRNRDFYTTISPSMDILVSSNLERLLYDLSGRDDEAVRGWYGELAQKGRFCVPETVRGRLAGEFYGGFCDDGATRETIGAAFSAYGYLCDPHTAVALRVYGEYRAATGDKTPVLIASTASPYKFAPEVLGAVRGEPASDMDEYEQLKALSALSKTEIPPSLLKLREKEVRFTRAIPRDAVREEIIRLLGL